MNRYHQTKLACGHQIKVNNRTLRRKLFRTGDMKRRIRCNQCWGKPQPPLVLEGSTLAERELYPDTVRRLKRDLVDG